MTAASDGGDFLGPISTVGVICYYPTEDIPYGWLMCNGAAYSKTGDYARLGTKLGNKYNLVGDPNTVFRVPNLMNYDQSNENTLPYYIRSWNGHTASNIGTVQAGQVGEHSHDLSGNVGTESAHVHDRGSMNITGQLAGLSYDTADSRNGMDGAFSWKIEKTVKGASGGTSDRYANFNAANSWSGVTSGPRTKVGNTYEDGHTHSLDGISTDNNETDSTKENRVSSMLMVPIIKW